MKSRIIGGSYERAERLIEAGCPIDNLDDLPRHSFRAEKLLGYVESCVYAFGPRSTGYVIALRLRTDRASGTIIRGWRFEPPWPDHFIDWDYEPEDVIPRKHLDVYKSLLESRLMGVLNEGRLIRRGYLVDGVLCGRSYQPIGESRHGVVSAKLTLVDDLETQSHLCINLNVDTHSYSTGSRLSGRETRQRFFGHARGDAARRFDPCPIPAGNCSGSEPLRGDAD